LGLDVVVGLLVDLLKSIINSAAGRVTTLGRKKRAAELISEAVRELLSQTPRVARARALLLQAEELLEVPSEELERANEILQTLVRVDEAVERARFALAATPETMQDLACRSGLEAQIWAVPGKLAQALLAQLQGLVSADLASFVDHLQAEENEAPGADVELVAHSLQQWISSSLELLATAKLSEERGIGYMERSKGSYRLTVGPSPISDDETDEDWARAVVNWATLVLTKVDLRNVETSEISPFLREWVQSRIEARRRIHREYIDRWASTS
jgi:hypothetical protein